MSISRNRIRLLSVQDVMESFLDLVGSTNDTIYSSNLSTNTIYSDDQGILKTRKKRHEYLADLCRAKEIDASATVYPKANGGISSIETGTSQGNYGFARY